MGMDEEKPSCRVVFPACDRRGNDCGMGGRGESFFKQTLYLPRVVAFDYGVRVTD